MREWTTRQRAIQTFQSHFGLETQITPSLYPRRIRSICPAIVHHSCLHQQNIYQYEPQADGTSQPLLPLNLDEHLVKAISLQFVKSRHARQHIDQGILSISWICHKLWNSSPGPTSQQDTLDPHALYQRDISSQRT